jgi:hypothetical protein
MAEYKGIKGFKVQYLSADPSDPIIGQTWYNSTSKDLKYTSVTTAGSWATGGNMATARNNLAGAGTQTAGLVFGGGPSPNATEEYDGSTWSPGGNMGSGRVILAGCGTQTAGLGFGGYGPGALNATEEYDGTSWTAGGNLGTARYALAGAGIQTAGLAVGGQPTPAATEEYDGSSWTAGGNLGTGRTRLAGSRYTNCRFNFWCRTCIICNRRI